MQPSKQMLDGWNMMTIILGENSAAQFGANYIASIEKEINDLSKVVNNRDTAADYYEKYKNTSVEQQKGNVAEDFQAHSFNVDTLAKSSYLRAIKLGANTVGSVDTVIVDVRKLTKDEWLNPSEHYDSIVGKSTKSYQMKVYNDPKKAFDALFDSRYSHDDQLALTTKDTKEYLEQNENGIKHVLRKTSDIRPEVAEASKHTANTLTDHMEQDGINAKPATNARYKEMAKASRGEAEYNPKDDDLSINASTTVGDLVRESLKAGVTAATITFILQLAPEIVKVIDYLVKNGELDWKQISEFGEQALTATAKSVIRGSIASGLVFAAKNGILGNALETIDASMIGALVVVVMETVVNSIKLAAGKITARQMGMSFIDSTVLVASFLASAKLGGIIGQAIAPQLPIVGYLIGTLIGCSVGVLYNVGKKRLISFCKDTGFKCFGLVDQDYSVPEELLHEMGIDTAQIERTKVDRVGIDVLTQENIVGKNEIETVSYKMVNRGIIAVNKVGYILR